MASSILRGTTPMLRISISTDDLLLENAKNIELTFKFNGNTGSVKKHNRENEPVSKHSSELLIDTEENTIAYHFSEAETLRFDPNGYLQWQLRIQMNTDEIYGTPIRKISISDLLSKEVMTSG